MAALRRPAGPAYSLLRERPGGNEVVGITHQYGPGAEADHRFLHSGLLQARRGHVLGAPRPVRLRLRHFQTRRRSPWPITFAFAPTLSSNRLEWPPPPRVQSTKTPSSLASHSIHSVPRTGR